MDGTFNDFLGCFLCGLDLSTLATLSRAAKEFFVVGAALCIVEYLATSQASNQQMPVATPAPSPYNEKGLQASLNVLRGAQNCL